MKQLELTIETIETKEVSSLGIPMSQEMDIYACCSCCCCC